MSSRRPPMISRRGASVGCTASPTGAPTRTSSAHAGLKRWELSNTLTRWQRTLDTDAMNPVQRANPASKPRHTSIALALAACALLFAGDAFAACPTNKQPKSAPALVEIEQRWARALQNKDGEAVACLLAPEFMDTDPEGTLK